MKTNINRLRKDFGWTYCFGETVFEFDSRGFMLMTPGQPGGLWAFARPRGFRITGNGRYFVFGSAGDIFRHLTEVILLCDEKHRTRAYQGVDLDAHDDLVGKFRKRCHRRRYERMCARSEKFLKRLE